MNRRTVLAIAAMVVVVLFLSFLAVALIPLWVPVMLIKPDITSELQRKLTQRFTRVVVRQMMSV